VSAVVFLIEQTSNGLYILLGIGILWYWRNWIEARRAYRATNFELERDIARDQSVNAVTGMVLLAEVVLIVVGIQQVVAPTVRADMELQGMVVVEEVTQGDGEFATPTRPAPSGQIPVDPSGIDLGGQEVRAIFITPTLTPTLVGTIEAGAPEPIGCAEPNARLLIPANGMRVFQTIRVTGSAFVDNFSSYKLEINGPATLNQYAVIDEGTIPVMEDGTLSQFNPAPYEPGTYLFRLTVFDTTTDLKASCQVTIYISEPIPTPTPLGS
jgi:hypothetical protein